MQIIKPSVELLAKTNLIGDNTELSSVKLLEQAIRNCYKSEDKITDESYVNIINTILNNNHTSTLEHACFTFRIITSRDVLQELARHRIASYSVESTRYCNYGEDKKGMKFIQPAWISDEDLAYAESLNNIEDPSSHNIDFNTACIVDYLSVLRYSESKYNSLLKKGWKPQQARITLPGNLKTEIVMTMNIRSLLNFLTLRTSQAAHPDMRVVANMIEDILKKEIPIIFNK